MDITAQDDTGEFAQAERDPWMFYLCGKRGLIVVTSDGLFRKSFPHMAAIALGDTTVIAFTNNSYNADVRARAFLKANAELEKELRKRSRRKRRSFIGIIGMQGSFRVAEEKPMPHRKICDPRDWESYERVCANEGRLPLAPKH